MGEVSALFARVPVGWSVRESSGRRYGVTRALGAGGRSQRLHAEALDGTDVISANLCRLNGREVLKPCEMQAERVVAFLDSLDP